MRAHIIENGVVVNTIIVDSLDVIPGLVDAEGGGSIGDHVIDGKFVTPERPVADIAAEVRAERDSKLATTDWSQAADVPQATKDKWAPYRQALRDVPQQAGFPFNVVWPQTP